MVIAAIYARKSTDQTGVADEAKSVTRQVEHARAYAQRKGWTVADEHVYVDDGISGAEFANRPGFVRLMNALKPRPSFQVLVMSEESRLGREAIETAYALKQIITSSVRVFFYLEDRERTLDSPTDKIMLSLTTFADELEREKARQRTADAMLRLARAGRVTGGAVFGYRNRDVLGPDGHRSHVVREIDQEQAAVVREIFQLASAGVGVRGIAKRLNERAAQCPRPQQGRPAGWAPSSVHEILGRELYRGEVVWGRTKKRDRWGLKRPARQAEANWIRVEVPGLRIVPEELWQTVQTHREATRRRYLASTAGERFGRPPSAYESKYLLTGLVRCGECGSNLVVRSRSHGQRRVPFYACSAFHHRGHRVCANSLDAPLALADETILRDIERFVLHPKVIARALELALAEFRPAVGHLETERRRLRSARQTIEQELGRLTAALAIGGELASVVDAIREREHRRNELTGALERLEQVREFRSVDVARVERQAQAKLGEWREILRSAPEEARHILRALLEERLTFRPVEIDGQRMYRYEGKFTVGGLFSGVICPQLLASPTGFEPVF